MGNPKQSRLLSEVKDLSAIDAEVISKHVEGKPEYLAAIVNVENLHYSEEKIGQDDLNTFEAIVMDYGRPVLLVENDRVEVSESEVWQERLSACADSLSENIKRVGRVEVAGHPGQAYLESGEEFFLGTCSVIGADLVLTNRHVALEFCEPDGRIKAGMVPRVDFVEEANRDPDQEVQIIRAVEIGTDFDYAILEVEGGPLPTPVNFAASAQDLTAKEEYPLVYIVGYPAFDTRNPTDVQCRLFAGKFNVKRLAPGRLRKIVGPPPYVGYKRMDQTLVCDYTSLGGNSGSPVFDLASGLLVGLHYAGRYAEANYAAPIWSILDRIKKYTGQTKQERRETMNDKFIEDLLTERVMYMPVGKAKSIAATGFNPRSPNEVTSAAAAMIVLGHFGEEQLRQRLANALSAIHPSLRNAIGPGPGTAEMAPPGWDDWNPNPGPYNPRPHFPPGPYGSGDYRMTEKIDGKCVAGTVGGAIAGGIQGGRLGGGYGAAIGAVGGGLKGAADSGCFDK